MPFTTALGALLGGATEEAHKIKSERFEKEKSDLNLTTQMLQDVMHNPYTSADVKSHAYGAMKDVLMEHLFPEQFTGNAKNPVRKLVDQFVGQQETGPASAAALKQLGVGSGNARPTQLGGTAQPTQPIPPMPRELASTQMDVGGGQSMQQPTTTPTGVTPNSVGGAVSPQAALGVPSQGGFVNQWDVQTEMERRKIEMEQQARLKMADQLDQQLRQFNLTDQQRAQARTTLLGGNITPQPIPDYDYRPVYNSESGKNEVHVYRKTAQGAVLERKDPAPMTAEMQQVNDDAQGILDAFKTNPTGPLAAEIKKTGIGGTLPEIRSQLQAKKYLDTELVRLEREKLMETNEAVRKVQIANYESIMDARKQQPLTRLADKIQDQAEREYQKQLSDYEKSPFQPFDPKDPKAMFKQKPAPDRAKIYEDIAKQNGISGDVLRSILGNQLSAAPSAKPAAGAGTERVNVRNASTGETRSIPRSQLLDLPAEWQPIQ